MKPCNEAHRFNARLEYQPSHPTTSALPPGYNYNGNYTLEAAYCNL